MSYSTQTLALSRRQQLISLSPIHHAFHVHRGAHWNDRWTDRPENAFMRLCIYQILVYT